MPLDFRVTVGRGSEVSARLYEAAGHPGAWLALAPGAGAGHDHRFMVAFGRGLASRGLHVVTFNFPYVERGRRVPDSNETLEACWVAVLESVVEKAGPRAPIFVGGKSMGGRIASQVAAKPGPGVLSGLVFLGYPLHPPGRPEQRRTAHWPGIRVPALFVQGSRDAFGSPDEVRAELPRYRGHATLLVIEGGDHSLAVPRKSGRSQEEVYDEVQGQIVRWIGEKC
jgi:predicted alpha/beta-hydrolase family hydrolase